MFHFIAIKNAILKAPVLRESRYPYAADLSPERLRALRAAPHFQKLMTEIREWAKRAADTPIEPLSFSLFHQFELNGARKEYERAYFDRRGRLLALTLASVVDETDEHLATLNDLVWELCAEYTWCLPAHLPSGVEANKAARRPPERVVDLFAAETAHALAETLAMLDGRLDPWIEYRVREEIERRVLRPLFDDPVPFVWETSPANWSAVCAGAAGMAALLLVDDRERLSGMIDRVIRAMECFLTGYGSDGGCAEGMGYWAYGFGYYVYFADMLHVFTDGALDLFSVPKVEQIASFAANACLSDQCYPAFSDAAGTYSLPTGLLCRLSSRLGVPVPTMPEVPSLHADHCYRQPATARSLIWTDPALFGKPVPEGTSFFADLQWVIDRGRLGDVAVSFAAKGGHNAEPHNHNDLGHFIVHAGGEDLLTDLGAGLYTRDYFGPKRYSLIHNSSEGHSVPVINGKPQQPGAVYRAEMLRCERGEDEVLRYELDVTKAYAEPELVQWRRTFDWDCRPAGDSAVLCVHDEFSFENTPRQLEETWISRLEPEIGGGMVLWRGERAVLSLSYDPERFEAETERLETRDHMGCVDVVFRTRMRVKKPEKEMKLDFKFVLTLLGS